MASAFWTLEDGRVLARRWTGMVYMLELITHELKEIKGAEAFHQYLEQFVFREDNGDEPNGYGGFIRKNESIMFNFDIKSFAPINRNYFWKATQSALTRLKIQNDKKYENIESLLTLLLDMHKRIKKREDPMILTDMRTIEPETNERLGPGW